MPRKVEVASGADIGFDMTPMIDVVFQLITFFIVALSFEESQAAAKLTLPVADMAQPPKNIERELFVFNVVNLNAKDKEGNLVFPRGTQPYVVTGEHVSTETLRKHLNLAAEASRIRNAQKGVESAVIIRGDRDTAWAYVMVAMKQAQEAGFIKVYLTALQEEEPGLRKK